MYFTGNITRDDQNDFYINGEWSQNPDKLDKVEEEVRLVRNAIEAFFRDSATLGSELSFPFNSSNAGKPEKNEIKNILSLYTFTFSQ